MNIYKEALEKFGIDKQLRQTQEECAELIVAISHYKKGRENSIENLIEELVDVQIMINQLVLILGDSNCADMMKNKLGKLSVILNK